MKTMTAMNIYWVGTMACTLVACAVPCRDDGLFQNACPAEGAGGGGGGHGLVGGDGGSSGAEGLDETWGSGDGESGASESLWCLDLDGDGFGDPEHCTPSDEPVDGSVDNADDCDDQARDTYPGAAPLDDPRACMRDADGDDWGDDDPPEGVEAGTDCADDNAFAFPGAAELEDPDLCAEDADEDGWGDIDPPEGVDAGTDCLDDNPFAFPGAAELEEPPDLCTLDADDDGWGEADPSARVVVPGSDCYDANADLNPGSMRLSAFVLAGEGYGASALVAVDRSNAELSHVLDLVDSNGSIMDVEITTATVGQTGQILVNDSTSVAVEEADYAGVCLEQSAVLEPLSASVYGEPGDVLCGLEYAGDGLLYGIDHDDTLLTIDPTTGLIVNSVPIELMGIPLNINACDMAYDCAEDRLLVANGVSNTIFSIDPASGEVQPERNLEGALTDGPWDHVGLEYDQVEHRAYLSLGVELYRVDLDSAAAPEFVGSFSSLVHNLQNLPICS